MYKIIRYLLTYFLCLTGCQQKYVSEIKSDIESAYFQLNNREESIFIERTCLFYNRGVYGDSRDFISLFDYDCNYNPFKIAVYNVNNNTATVNYILKHKSEQGVVLVDTINLEAKKIANVWRFDIYPFFGKEISNKLDKEKEFKKLQLIEAYHIADSIRISDSINAAKGIEIIYDRP
jgi:hypothetical protein